MEITNEIKAKVFAQYIGQKIDISQTEWYKLEKKGKNRLTKIILNGLTCVEDIVRLSLKHDIIAQNNGVTWLDTDVCKLILKPLSEISNEDSVGLYKAIKYGLQSPVYILENIQALPFDKAIIAYQYLISKGYDLPNHLLDGKTLQECNLAIYEKPKK